ncbi:ribonuclease [Zoogloeaceae bacteirum Par-f-2]|nr:ribonuclease [Zoogloeaceae bacteirum Par-f-2]
MRTTLTRLLSLFALVAALTGCAPPAGTNHDLPPEAHATLALIQSGGPFPYRKDGSVFHNREGLLPERPRGYYREYTVPTPGARDRGARRIVAGGQPPEVFYYTEDHYRSFRRIEPPR